MKERDPEAASGAHVFVLLLTNWRAVAHLLALVVLTFAGLACCIVIGTRMLRGSGVEVTQTDHGLIYRVGAAKTEVLMLPGSATWLSSGFVVKHGDSVRVKASGRVNLSLFRLVEASQTKQRPGLPWVDPRGVFVNDLNWVDDREHRQYIQDNCVLLKKQALGALLYAVAPESTDPGTLTPEFVGLDKTIEVKRDGVLWFVVNEVVFDDTPTSKDCFEHAPKNKYLTMTWDELVKEKYWNVWYDDNVGEFLITIYRED